MVCVFARKTSEPLASLVKQIDGKIGENDKLKSFVVILSNKEKADDDLRKLGYNELLQAVNSSDNPLLHFLQGSVDRHVRNALMHAGVSSSLSKGVVSFADRKNEVEWKMGEFIRRTRNLILTILAVEYLEPLFNYARAYYTFAAVRYLRANPPGDSPVCSDVDSTASKAARATA